MSQVSDQNQFSALSSPTDDGKSQEGLRSRFGKDDIKEQAFQAREMVKSRVLDPVMNLKEQVISSVPSTAGIVDSVTAQLQPAIDLVKSKAGLGGVSNEEAVAQVTDNATGQWEEVKRKGSKQARKVKDQVDAQLDANLTPAQKAKLQKGMLKAKAKGAELQGQARGLSSQLINLTLSNPRLRPVKSFIYRNNLQLPAVILGSLLSLWVGLTVIRLVTDVATPKVPEFDIHSKENTIAWLKYHTGDYKDRAVDAQESLAARAANILSNYEIDKLKGRAVAKAGKLAGKAVDWREIGLGMLGLQEPTWGEWAWAKLTGRPITWQDRVESVLSLAKAGISRPDLKSHTGLFDRVKDYIHPHEPTMAEKAAGVYDSIRANIPGMKPEPVGTFDSIKNSIVDGIDTIRSKLPGGESVEAARQRAYEATHQSTLGKVQSGLNYAANRIVHGSQEAAHVAQDNANKAADKAKWKLGL